MGQFPGTQVTTPKPSTLPDKFPALVAIKGPFKCRNVDRIYYWILVVINIKYKIYSINRGFQYSSLDANNNNDAINHHFQQYWVMLCNYYLYGILYRLTHHIHANLHPIIKWMWIDKISNTNYDHKAFLIWKTSPQGQVLHASSSNLRHRFESTFKLLTSQQCLCMRPESLRRTYF